MNKTITKFLVFLAIAIASPAAAAGPGCIDTTGVLVLEKPRRGATGPQVFGCFDRTLDILSDNSSAVDGHAITDEGGAALPAVSTLNFVGAGVTAVQNGDAIDITIEGIAGDNIRNVGTHIGQVTTVSPVWESVAGSTLSLQTEGSNALIIDYSCNLECVDFTSCGVAFSFLVDGEFFDGGSAALEDSIAYIQTEGSRSSAPNGLMISHRTDAKLSIATHEISLLWASEDSEQIRMGRKMDGCSLTYREDYDTLAGGSVAIVSGQTQLGSQSSGSLETLECSTLPCTSQGDGTFGNYWIWVATGTGPGDWINTFNGLGPSD